MTKTMNELMDEAFHPDIRLTMQVGSDKYVNSVTILTNRGRDAYLDGCPINEWHIDYIQRMIWGADPDVVFETIHVKENDNA